MNEKLLRTFHKLIDRHGFIVKREVVEGMASRLGISVNAIPVFLQAMDDQGLWGCAERPTIKFGWFDPASPEGTVCPRPHK